MDWVHKNSKHFFVNLEIAKLLKDKFNYNETCIAYFSEENKSFHGMPLVMSYDDDTNFGSFVPNFQYDSNNLLIAAPTWDSIYEFISNNLDGGITFNIDCSLNYEDKCNYILEILNSL